MMTSFLDIGKRKYYQFSVKSTQSLNNNVSFQLQMLMLCILSEILCWPKSAAEAMNLCCRTHRKYKYE